MSVAPCKTKFLGILPFQQDDSLTIGTWMHRSQVVSQRGCLGSCNVKIFGHPTACGDVFMKCQTCRWDDSDCYAPGMEWRIPKSPWLFHYYSLLIHVLMTWMMQGVAPILGLLHIIFEAPCEQNNVRFAVTVWLCSRCSSCTISI